MYVCYYPGAYSVSIPDYASNMVANSENPNRINYYHERVKEHLDDLRDQAKNPQTQEGNGERVPMQTIVFQRKHITLLNRALRDPSHRLRNTALALMQEFTRAAERGDETKTLNQAAKEYGIPQKNLSEWVAKGLIPYENRDEYAVYVRRDTLDKIAPVYRKAKDDRKPAAPILREMHDELFPESSPHPLNVDKASGS
jgi:hypothetical protein